MLKNAFVASLALLVVGGTALAQAPTNDRPVNWKELPKPFHTESARNSAEVISRPEGAELRLPSGFKIEEYMSGFNRPRFMMHGGAGEILLTDSGSRDESNGDVYVLKDGSKSKILDGLNRPYGLELHDGWLYVGEPESVKRYRYDSATMKVTGQHKEGEEIISYEGLGRGHWTRTLLFNEDRTKLYVTVGSGSNIDQGEDALRAALHRYNPDGSGHETVATGLRNTIGLRWYPGTNDLWAAVQERDHLGDDLVPDYVVKIEEGGTTGGRTPTSGRTQSRVTTTSTPPKSRARCIPTYCSALTSRCWTLSSTPATSFRKNIAAVCSWHSTAHGTAPSASATKSCSSRSRTPSPRPARRASSTAGCSIPRSAKSGDDPWDCYSSPTAQC